MSLNSPVPVAALMTVFVLLATAGCGKSKPTRYFVLETHVPDPAPRGATDSERTMVVGIAPVKVAPYIDRKQIVTRQSSVTVHVSDHESWAEPFETSITRAVAVFLDGEPGIRTAIILPTIAEVALDRVVLIEVARLDGMLGGAVRLSARVIILDADRVPLHTPLWFDETADTADASYESLAIATNELLEKLSAFVAQALRTVN